MLRKLVCFLILFTCFSSALFAQRYVFFLHNKFAEEHKLSESHPAYGKTQYLEVLNQFKQAGFEVISEKRAANTDVYSYASKVVKQIDSLLKKGIKPDHITVIGTSKGGYIAQHISTLAKNPALNFIFIGCYRDQDLIDIPEINFCGNILTIYEKTDEFGVSAIKRKETSKLKVSRFRQLELNTGLKHGFLFRAMPEWINPSIQWANGNYNFK